ncbi:MAG: metal-dependent transcriptional regulator [Microbacterium sp.]
MSGRNGRSGARSRYLRAIWIRSDMHGEPVTVTSLSRALGHVPGTVSEQITRLARDGFVIHERYKPIALTPQGRRRAVRAIRDNRLVRCFLSDVLHIPWAELITEAENLEGHTSRRFIEHVEASLHRPCHDPFGQPIPTMDEFAPEIRPDAPLPRIASRHWISTTITRIDDAPVDTLAFFHEQRLTPARDVRVRQSPDGRGAIEVTTDTSTVFIPASDAAFLRACRSFVGQESDHPRERDT